MKKILIISFYWPPSGKASMQWPLDMAESLFKNGFEPAVLTVKQDTFSESDNSFNDKINPAIPVIRTDFWDPFIIYKKFLGKSSSDTLAVSETISKGKKGIKHKISLWIRMNLFVPDARIGWLVPGARAAQKYMHNKNFDLIISNGPPHSSHLIGKKLSKKFKIPLVSVFIDPWVDISYYKEQKRNPVVVKIDNALEKSVMKYSARLVFVTKTLKDYFDKKYPFTKNKSEVLHWGYNERDFAGLKKEKSKNEILLHAGNMYDYQNPAEFWKTLKSEIAKGRNLTVRFIGTVGPKIKSSLEEAGIIGDCEFKGFLPYESVVKEMMNASYLLVCAAEPRHVPGKLFEYMRTGNPVIAFGDDNSEVKELLEESKAGILFDYKNSGSEFFEFVKNHSPDIEYSKRFDRSRIAEKLISVIEKI